jgi:hypothetical protein
MFEHPERLIQALQLLGAHREEIQNFYASILHLQVQADGIDKLKEAFRASVSERRGASFNRGEGAVQAFDNSIQNLVQQVNAEIENNPEQAHRLLFESIVMLPNIDQKIAAMFIKFLVVYLNEWPSMLPYLYVPIDRVVLKILGEKLQVYIGPWNQSPSVKNPSGRLYVRGNRMSAQYTRFITFQNELGQIAQNAGVDRILADELWFIGYIFCKEYPLCNRCWVRGVCQGSPFN